MQAALKTLRLTPERQAALAAAIEAGQPAKEAVAAYFPKTQASPNARTPVANSARPSDSGPATLPELLEEFVGIVDDTSELLGVVDTLRTAIEDVVRADISTDWKNNIIVQATVLLDAMLDEIEMELA